MTVPNIGFGFDQMPALARRWVATKDGWRAAGSTRNSGIASYICEFHCMERAQIAGTSLACASLVTQIVEEAQRDGQSNVWGWEANPSQADYSYPADWDDTCKAIDALNMAKKIGIVNGSVSMPSNGFFLKELQVSRFESEFAGEDVKIACHTKEALYMFFGGTSGKRNNAEDVMVTAVALRCLLRWYPEVVAKEHKLFRKLASRLVEVAEIGLAKSVPFCDVSRCYLSWAHFLRILLELGHDDVIARDRVARLAKSHLFNSHWRRLLPPKLRGGLSELERLFRVRLARAMHLPWEEVADASQHAIEPKLFYRHRRLNHWYSCEPFYDQLVHHGVAESGY